MSCIHHPTADIRSALDQRGDRSPLESVGYVVVPVDPLAGQGNKQRTGCCLARVDDDLADALFGRFTLRAVSG